MLLRFFAFLGIYIGCAGYFALSMFMTALGFWVFKSLDPGSEAYRDDGLTNYLIIKVL